MPVPALTIVALQADLRTSLAQLPSGPGVGQILGPGARSLLIGRASNLRRWAAANLGGGPSPRPGKRPRTDLRPVAAAVGFAPTTSAFHQRLAYERLMALYVPPAARRDLRPPAFLHLDLDQRFPRVTIGNAERGAGGIFGPFRNRKAAEGARTALHKLFPLRPCDYSFEPDPALPLGLGCVYAQVRSCAAPCLARVSEEVYRGLARDAVGLLAHPEARPPELKNCLPPWVGAGTERGLVVAAGREGIELYPLKSGEVLDELSLTTTGAQLEESLRGLRWDPATRTGQDWPWLSAWLHSPRGIPSFVPVAGVADGAALLEGVRAALREDVAGARPR